MKKTGFFSKGHLLVSKNAGLFSCRTGECPSSPPVPSLPAPRACSLPISPRVCFKHWQGRSAGGAVPLPSLIREIPPPDWLGVGQWGTASTPSSVPIPQPSS